MDCWDGHCYDVLGIGFGPANIALTIALEESGFSGSVLMLERRSASQWHPDMLLEGSDIQNHGSRDLITPHNPRSRYTFLNYLHEHGRLLEHLNLGIEFPLRREYAAYISWVAAQFGRWVRYGVCVDSISLLASRGENLIRVSDSNGKLYVGRSLVIAPGRTPHVPSVFEPLLGPNVFHLTEYLTRIRELERSGAVGHICVIGGSQSGAELMLDLSARYRASTLSNVMRGYGYRLKDTSQFSERVFLPEFVDYYYQCDAGAKARLDRALEATNYSSVDADVIRQLYVRLYEERLENRNRIHLYTNHEVQDCARQGPSLSLSLREINTSATSVIRSLDAIVLATGFRNLGTQEHQERYPAILRGIIDALRSNSDGVLQVERDYQLLPRDPTLQLAPIYLNGLCESSHGLGDAGSISLLSIRSAQICQSLTQALGQRAQRAGNSAESRVAR
jgi:L-ornithine N5-oxygenase